AIEETLVALGSKLTLEQVPKIDLHGLATCSGPRGDGVSNFFSNILDLQGDRHLFTVHAHAHANVVAEAAPGWTARSCRAGKATARGMEGALRLPAAAAWESRTQVACYHSSKRVASGR